MRLLDRYVIRNFMQVYFYCIAGFISIWLIFDVSDNISNFIDNHIAVSLVVRYYATQIPQVLIILLPVALLLSLLFALGRMSRANEIVSMLTAGVSLPRVLLPLIGIGTGAQIVSLRSAVASCPQYSGASLSQSKRIAHLVYPEFSPWRQHVQQRAGAATGRERQYRHELRGCSGLLPA